MCEHWQMVSNVPMPADDSGYRLTPTDLEFLQISQEAALKCVSQTTPLGMTDEEYRLFVEELREALWREHFSDVDVRLQGSSAKAFSGPHKEMPYSREDVNEALLIEHQKAPTTYQIGTSYSAIQKLWPEESRPRRRPFDALFRIGISPDRSDYDIQISTNEAFGIIRKKALYRSLRPDELVVENSTYQFMRKEYSDSSFLYLQEWAANWWGILRRPVNIAIFIRTGPKKSPTKGDDLSSHFKDSDWIISVDASQAPQPLEQSGVTGG